MGDQLKNRVLALVAAVVPSLGSAAVVTPVSFTGPGQGECGTYCYSDSLLPNWTELLDGVVALTSYNSALTSSLAPWVGYQGQTILNWTFTFDQHYVFDRVEVVFDNANGGVSAPSLVSVVSNAGTTSAVGRADGMATFAGGPQVVTVDLNNVYDDSLAMSVDPYMSESWMWTFLSEITFYTNDEPLPAVPVPASLPMLAGAGLALAALRRRRA